MLILNGRGQGHSGHSGLAVASWKFFGTSRGRGMWIEPVLFLQLVSSLLQQQSDATCQHERRSGLFNPGKNLYWCD